MLDITPNSTRCVNIDRWSDYIPGVSSVTNLVDLVLKCLSLCIGKEKLQNNHYFAYLDTKTAFRCIVLLVPVIGNIWIAIVDIDRAIKAEERENLAGMLGGENCRRPQDEVWITQIYNSAACLGSVEGMYHMGLRCAISGKGLIQKDPILGRQYLRNAAALGHPEALKELGKLVNTPLLV